MHTATLANAAPAVPPCASKLRWGAILAGTTAALAIQIVLMMLGAGLGLAMFNPTSNDHAIASFGTGAAVIQGIAAVLSLWGGGWMAGRFMRNAGERSGRLHGFMVWCVATVVAVALLSTGAGWALGGLGKIVAGGFAMAGKPAVDGMSELAKNSVDRNQTLLASFTDEALSNPPAGKTPADNLRARRDLAYAVHKLFTAEEGVLAANRNAVVTLLVQHEGLTEADASRMVDGWVTSYQTVKADANAAMQAMETKAKQAGEESAGVLSVLSLSYFAAFMLGAMAACHGGTHGAQCAGRHHGKATVSHG